VSAPLTVTQAIPSPARRFSGMSVCIAVLIALCIAGQAMPASADMQSAAGKAEDTASPPATTQWARVEFNTNFLSPQARAGIDVTRFEKGNPVPPGEYRVELYLNNRALGRTDITVKPGADPDRGRVCMTRALLDQVGVDWNQLDPSAFKALEKPAACPLLEELVTDAQAEFDTGELRLNLSLPQQALRRTPRGYVSPELWDSGVTGGMLSYTLNAYRNDLADSTTNAAYLGLKAGFNAGDWHFRHQGAENWQSQSGPSASRHSYQNINTYVERELPAITGRVTLGDGNTFGRLFNTQSFRGVQLATDDRMLPDSQRGYAPVIRGIAETNARVTIRQGGVILYDTPVPPGPFVIDDLYPTGYGGDLDVSITEGDGRVRTFTVPFASVPQLLRQGSYRYSLTAGTLRNTWLSFTPTLFEATYQRGLMNGLTGYGGVQANDRYTAVLAGVALDTPLGALALDLTGARTQLPDGRDGDSTLSGTSTRLSYSKVFQQTGSNLSLAAYRYSDSGFLEMADAMRAVDTVKRGLSSDLITRPRSRLSVSLSQPLGQGWGQLYLSGFTQDYWDDRRTDTQFQAGYGNRLGPLFYSISVARMTDPTGDMDNRVMLTLSLPLGQAAFMTTNLTHSSTGTATQAMLSGSVDEEHRWSYGASVAHGPGDTGTAATANSQYIGSKATVNASYGTGRNYNNASAGLSGSIVAHPEGLTLSPYASDTVAVIAAAPEAAAARVLGYPGVTLDASGHAVLPYLTPYRINEVAIDPNGISPDVELKTTSQKIAPRAGAITMLRYAMVSGRAVLIDASLPDGATLPFGADVVDGDGNLVGSVGQAGRIYARLPADEARLFVRWGQAQNEQCSMRVALPALPPASRPMDTTIGIRRLQLACVPGAAGADDNRGVTK